MGAFKMNNKREKEEILGRQAGILGYSIAEMKAQ